MKTLLCLAVLLTAPLLLGEEAVKLWDGKARGMDLVAIGHKRVTVYLADGRTTVVGIPILVEKPKAAAEVSNGKSAINNRGNHAPHKR
jgi:hypothetical protein